MKRFAVMLGVGLVGFACTIAVYGDCGKIGIKPRPPRVPLTQPHSNDIPDLTDSGGGSNEIPPVPPIGGRDGIVDVPETLDDTIPGTLSLYKEPRQHALVAWNGKEQMLFLTTNEQSVSGTRAMISIMPLPGAPIAIKKSDKGIIKRAYDLVQKKILESPQRPSLSGGLGVVLKTEIGAHKIFVWKVDDIGTLKNDLNQFIAKTYGRDFSLMISQDGFAVIKNYHERGFRYFAFDLLKVDGQAEKTKEAIMYHYQSNFAFYPVAISQVGGTGISSIVLTMISPKGFNKVGGSIGGMDAGTLGNARQGCMEVDLSLEDLRTITPPLAAFYQNQGKATARIFEFTGNLDGSNAGGRPGLNKDVILWSE